MPWYLRYPEKARLPALPAVRREVLPPPDYRRYDSLPPARIIESVPPPRIIEPLPPARIITREISPDYDVPPPIRRRRREPETRSSKSNNNGIILCFGVLFLLLLLGVVAWAGYFTVKLLGQDKTTAAPAVVTAGPTSPSTTAANTNNNNNNQPEASTLTVSGSAAVTSWPFSPDLNNQASVEYKDKATKFCTMIESIFQSTVLKGSLVSCLVTDLRQGSTIVEYTLTVRRSRSTSDDAVIGLVMRQVHCGMLDTTLNPFIAIKPDSIYFREGTSGPVQRICSGTCTKFGLAYVCTCALGYQLSGDGSSCIDTNECSTNNGGCTSNCTNTPGSYQCGCAPGFQLDGNQKNCSDADECSTQNGGCTDTCTNTMGSFICSCPDGEGLYSDGKTCLDVNECLDNAGGCSQQCVNRDGYYECQCNTGYTLGSDNKTCIDINECQTNNGGCGGVCTNTEGSHNCSCTTGYILQTDGKTCADVNECLTGNGGCQQVCVNTYGGRQCQCLQGYTTNATYPLTCDAIPWVPCFNGSQCDGANGGCDVTTYTCTCNQGYTLAADNSTCLDVDECLDKTTSGCSDGCSNSPGSYSCSCPQGYILGSDLRTCQDIDECNVGQHQCERVCQNGTFPVPGYTCGCDLQTYPLLAPDGRACIRLENLAIVPPSPAVTKPDTVEYLCIAIGRSASRGTVLIHPQISWTDQKGNTITSTNSTEGIYLTHGGLKVIGFTSYLGLSIAGNLTDRSLNGVYTCNMTYSDPWRSEQRNSQLTVQLG